MLDLKIILTMGFSTAEAPERTTKADVTLPNRSVSLSELSQVLAMSEIDEIDPA